MNRIRFAPVAALIAMIGYYLTTALTANGMPLPPEPPAPVPGPASDVAAVAPPHSIVVHDHVSAWTYTLVVVAAIAATLLVVLVVSRFRAPKSPKPAATHIYRGSFGRQDV